MVLQGIRIRLGRSLVTLTGIILGIAFLMSILTSQSLRDGVRQESEMRANTQRMLNILMDEAGPVAGRTVGVLQLGPPNDVERRFIALLRKEKVAAFRWTGAENTPATGMFPPANVQRTDRNAVGKDATVLLVVGDGPAPRDLDWGSVLRESRRKVVAVTRRTHKVAADGVAAVTLERRLRPDEIEQLAGETRRNQFRTVWIIVISLLVTVIGICNAMLMSVTERFREIGTMKCLGALSYFVRQLFFIEASLMGLAGSLSGVVLGTGFTTSVFASTYGWELTFSSLAILQLLGYGCLALVVGVVLSIIAAIYPANFASKMVPASALRSNV